MIGYVGKYGRCRPIKKIAARRRRRRPQAWSVPSPCSVLSSLLLCYLQRGHDGLPSRLGHAGSVLDSRVRPKDFFTGLLHTLDFFVPSRRLFRTCISCLAVIRFRDISSCHCAAGDRQILWLVLRFCSHTGLDTLMGCT